MVNDSCSTHQNSPFTIPHSLLKNMDFRFRRTERLKSEKVISSLFKKGHSFSCYPLRLVYTEMPIPPTSSDTTLPNISGCSISKSDDLAEFSPIQFSLSVSKKKFQTGG